MTETARSSFCSICSLRVAGEDGRCTECSVVSGKAVSDLCPHCKGNHAAIFACSLVARGELVDQPVDGVLEGDPTQVMDAKELEQLLLSIQQPITE